MLHVQAITGNRLVGVLFKVEKNIPLRLGSPETQVHSAKHDQAIPLIFAASCKRQAKGF